MARITVEDCLEHVDNRFQLVHVAVLRSRQLDGGYLKHVEDTGEKNTIIALREIADGKVDKEIIKKQSAGIFEGVEEGKTMEESFRDIAQQELAERQRQAAAIEEQEEQQEEETQLTEKEVKIGDDIDNIKASPTTKKKTATTEPKLEKTASLATETKKTKKIKEAEEIKETKRPKETAKEAGADDDRNTTSSKKESATATKKDAKTKAKTTRTKKTKGPA